MNYLAFLLLIPMSLLGQAPLPVELKMISDSVWVHTTYKLVGNNNIPSNGLVIQTSDGLVLIDTPWDDSLTMALLDSAQKKLCQSITLAIITHAHDDRIGGIGTLRKRGIQTVALPLTCRRAEELGYNIPEQVSLIDTTFIVGSEKIELFYPGAGHTIDNSVVWLPERNILFGGCLVKAETNTNLGNVADADLTEWPQSIRRIMEKFSTARVVVPGHGTCGSVNLLKHTLDLLSIK